MTADAEGSEIYGDHHARTHTYILQPQHTLPRHFSIYESLYKKITLWRITEPKIYVVRSSSAYEFGECGPTAPVHSTHTGGEVTHRAKHPSPFTKEMKRSGQNETSPLTGSLCFFKLSQNTRGNATGTEEAEQIRRRTRWK